MFAPISPLDSKYQNGVHAVNDLATSFTAVFLVAAILLASGTYIHARRLGIGLFPPDETDFRSENSADTEPTQSQLFVSSINLNQSQIESEKYSLLFDLVNQRVGTSADELRHGDFSEREVAILNMLYSSHLVKTPGNIRRRTTGWDSAYCYLDVDTYSKTAYIPDYWLSETGGQPHPASADQLGIGTPVFGH